jgi:hypothetical protein
LTEEAIAPNSSKIVTQSQTQPKRKRVTSHGSINDSSQVKRLLQAALNECPPRSVTEIAEGLGYRSCSSLFYHASDLCHAISARYADYQKTERLKEIQYALEAVLGSQEYPPPPMYEVAKRLGTSVPTLKQYCPDLCNTITARCTSYRQESKTKRVQKLCQEIRLVALKLHTEGVAPTASRISEHLSKPAAILGVEAVVAVREVRRELGWEK